MNLLNEESHSKFLKMEHYQSNAICDVGNEVIYKTVVLKSNLCDYNDTYILVRGDITIVRENRAEVAFKNCVPIITCITKIDGTTIDDAEI